VKVNTIFGVVINEPVIVYSTLGRLEMNNLRNRQVAAVRRRSTNRSLLKQS
jgi:hypothetical protein